MTAADWLVVPAAAGVAAWLYLLILHHGFWRADQRLPAEPRAPARWPSVLCVVPARDEAETVQACLSALAAQDYPGRLVVVLVDDSSRDGTAVIARRAVTEKARHPMHLVAAPPPPAGWTGKLAALEHGVERGEALAGPADYLWFTDADVVHDPPVLRRLVAQAEAGERGLVSVMVRLACESAWERLLVPAFVFFFQMLYPFPAVNDDRSRVAGAAGGCLLVSRRALADAGGLAAVRGRLIDDCALARAVKDAGHGLWLGLGAESRSLRRYRRLGDFWAMVARTAFTQLRHSALLLAGTLLGLALVYLAPPLLLAGYPWHASPAVAAAGALAWLLMAAAYRPTLALYGRPPVAALALPLAAALYLVMTLDSALRHWRGSGGRWKGRVQAARPR